MNLTILPKDKQINMAFFQQYKRIFMVPFEIIRKFILFNLFFKSIKESMLFGNNMNFHESFHFESIIYLFRDNRN